MPCTNITNYATISSNRNTTYSNEIKQPCNPIKNISQTPIFPFPPMGFTWYIIIGICAVFIFCTGMYGNIILIRSTIDHTQKKVRKAMNIFLMTLAIYDILIISISMPVTLVEDLLLSWPFGRILCYILYYMPTIFATGSVFTIVAIAGERFRAVVYPMKPKLSTIRAILISLGIFLAAIAVTAPNMAFTTYDDKIFPLHPQCSHQFLPDPLLGNKIYVIFVFGCLFWLPLLFTGALYILIMYHLHVHRYKTILTVSGRIATDTNRRVVTMLLIILFVFFFSWLPLHICFFLAIFGSVNPLTNNFRIALTICHVISYLNCIINPVVYISFKNRTKFISTICCGPLFRLRSMSSSEHTGIQTKNVSLKFN